MIMIKHFEGLHLRAYLCANGIWTIGYGHTSGVTPDSEIAAEEAERLLSLDVREAEACIYFCRECPLNQNQFNALVSFVFNLGCRRFRTSTLLKKLNDGEYAGAAEEFPRWVKAGGVILPGLVRRREEEKKLFLGYDIN
jgi:lysozyme